MGGIRMWLVLALVPLGAACSSDSDGSTPGAGGGSNFDGANACLNIQNTATEITAVGDAGAAPAMTGGTLVDGTYFLTARTKYGDANWGGWKEKERLDIMNGGAYLSYVSAQSTGEIRGGLTAKASGKDLTVDGVCSLYAGQHLTLTYTATATTFSSLESNGKLSVYTKQ